MTRNPYESEQYLNEYLLFHYGRSKDICLFPFIPKEVLEFHHRIIDECLQPVSFKSPTRGLDLGCAVGRLTFELGRVVDHALGIDSSQKFIRTAQKLAKMGSARIRVKEEGKIFSVQNIKLSSELRKGEVEFQRGNAQRLAFGLKPFHVVLAINLIDRMADPRKFLEQVDRLLMPGGQLVIGSPYTWLEKYTSPRKWVGGYQIRGRVSFSSQGIRSILSKHFRFISSHDLPFLIREHRRKYQLGVSEISLFVRK